MKISPITRSALTLPAFASLFASCESPKDPPRAVADKPVAQAAGLQPPATLNGWVMSYTDNHSVNTWTFDADGTCVMKAVHHGGTDTNIVKSRWKWKTGPGAQARLVLDRTDTMTLDFSTPVKAVGTWNYDMRGYHCEFTPPRATN